MLSLSCGLICVNLARERVDLSKIDNRRFMYHPDGWLILGAEDVVSRKKDGLLKSHAEEYYEASLTEKLPPFDEFVRGWIGVGGAYKDGIVHFAPHIPSRDIVLFEKAFDFVEAVLRNGFSDKAVLRGFPGAWEQTVFDVFKDSVPLDERLCSASERSAETVSGEFEKADFVKG